jgi:hypothetical protein
MTMERFQQTLLLILASSCVFLTSCVDSDNPLSDPKEAKADKELFGVWRFEEPGGEVTYYHVGAAGKDFPAGVMRVKAVRHEANGVLPHPDNDDLLAFATTLGNNRYLNVTGLPEEAMKKMQKSSWEPSLAEGYWIFKYEIRGDKLVIAGMDPDQKEAAIKGGKIKGSIDGKNVRITDTTENLVRLVESADARKLFVAKETPDKVYFTLEKVK